MKKAKTPPIAIVGASARAAAFSIRRDGSRPLTADLFADADLVQCAQAVRIERYPHGLVDWLRTTPEDTFWMYTGALENYPDLVDEMAAVRPLLGCRGDVLRRVRDPLVLAGLLQEADVAFPETKALPTPLPLNGGRAGGGGVSAPANATKSIHPTAWLLKTYRGSSGSGVRVWDGQHPHDASAPLVLQRRIDGTPGSAIFVAARGNAILLGITRQLVGTSWSHAAPFQYAGSIGPWCLEDAVESELQRAGKAIAAAGVVGLFGVDFVLSDDDGRPYVVEVNPRYTASVEIVERLLNGLPAASMHTVAALGSLPSSRTPHVFSSMAKQIDAAFGKAILFATREISVMQAFTDWTRTKAPGPPWPELADLPHAGTSIAPGRPVLTVFAKGKAHGEVERELQVRMIEVERRLGQ